MEVVLEFLDLLVQEHSQRTIVGCKNSSVVQPRSFGSSYGLAAGRLMLVAIASIVYWGSSFTIGPFTLELLKSLLPTYGLSLHFVCIVFLYLGVLLLLLNFRFHFLQLQAYIAMLQPLVHQLFCQGGYLRIHFAVSTFEQLQLFMVVLLHLSQRQFGPMNIIAESLAIKGYALSLYPHALLYSAAI